MFWGPQRIGVLREIDLPKAHELVGSTSLQIAFRISGIRVRVRKLESLFRSDCYGWMKMDENEKKPIRKNDRPTNFWKLKNRKAINFASRMAERSARSVTCRHSFAPNLDPIHIDMLHALRW